MKNVSKKDLKKICKKYGIKFKKFKKILKKLNSEINWKCKN